MLTDEPTLRFLESPTGEATGVPLDDARLSLNRSREDLQRVLASHTLPVLPARDTVLFPLAVMPISFAGESTSIIRDTMAGERLLAVFTQKPPGKDMPALDDLYRVGTLASIAHLENLGGDSVHTLLQGLGRVKLIGPAESKSYLTARVELIEEHDEGGLESEGLRQAVLDQFSRFVVTSAHLPNELIAIARKLKSAAELADFVASIIELPLADKQGLLAEMSVRARLRSLLRYLGHELEVLEMGHKIQAQVQGSLDEQHRQFLLRQQLEAIQKELGEKDEGECELAQLRQKLTQARLPEAVEKEAQRELGRLAAVPAQSPEHAVTRSYLEWLGDMPWAAATEDNLDLTHARAVLDQDHYGLPKVKERILEYIAVRHFKSDARSPILCFVGPPGTGKTSLGRSIARALGRKFVRQSLGGVRDEAEIRGHRRTYIGALPGSIIQGIRRAGTNNPLFMLDEVDKLGADFRGDPASALLEVLDPEQNVSFVDHYLDVPFDLSRTLFICTANLLDPVPPALRDRMEVLELSGYTELEKLSIARLHLIPRLIASSGLGALDINVTDAALFKLIRNYTNEAGIRNLQREVEALLRKIAKHAAEGQAPPRSIDEGVLRELLGPEPFGSERVPVLDTPGAALGLAWTPTGGEVLVVEATAMPGKKDLILTGKLGDVMKESAQAALSYVRSHATELQIDPTVFERHDVHVHVPAGAIAKDGPSAGVALCAALVSLFSGRLPHPKTAMTGEITLRGRVLRVGGIKEKALAAHRAGLVRMVLPAENEPDLEEVPAEVRKALVFLPAERIEQALELALLPRTQGK